MEIENQENGKGLMSRTNNFLIYWVWDRFLQKIVNVVRNVAKEAKKLGKEDPRRIVHSLKVGLAITTVSLLYYFNFSYEGYGISAMWAVMTVVVIFEFSVGATLGKGINRGIATLLGGALALATHLLASFAGEKFESIILGLSVCLIGAVVTFLRFFPKLKARFDYGLMIFILTFSLISVSGYRDDEVFDMAKKRLFTILIGGFVATFVCIVICPIWAGEDLHKLTSTNINKLGLFLEGFGQKYLQARAEENQESESLMKEYISVLTSKGIEDSLANFARWEPRHGKFKYRHPWDQYLKIGSLTRECAYKIDVLNSFLNSNVEVKVELPEIQEPCKMISWGCSHALRELSIGIDTMTNRTLLIDSHIEISKQEVIKLESSLLKANKFPGVDMLGTYYPMVTVASLLIEVVACTTKIADGVRELGCLLRFKSLDVEMEKEPRNERVARNPIIESHIVNMVE